MNKRILRSPYIKKSLLSNRVYIGTKELYFLIFPIKSDKKIKYYDTRTYKGDIIEL